MPAWNGGRLGGSANGGFAGVAPLNGVNGLTSMQMPLGSWRGGSPSSDRGGAEIPKWKITSHGSACIPGGFGGTGAGRVPPAPIWESGKLSSPTETVYRPVEAVGARPIDHGQPATGC